MVSQKIKSFKKRMNSVLSYDSGEAMYGQNICKQMSLGEARGAASPRI